MQSAWVFDDLELQEGTQSLSFTSSQFSNMYSLNPVESSKCPDTLLNGTIVLDENDPNLNSTITSDKTDTPSEEISPTTVDILTPEQKDVVELLVQKIPDLFENSDTTYYDSPTSGASPYFQCGQVMPSLSQIPRKEPLSEEEPIRKYADASTQTDNLINTEFIHTETKVKSIKRKAKVNKGNHKNKENLKNLKNGIDKKYRDFELPLKKRKVAPLNECSKNNNSQSNKVQFIHSTPKKHFSVTCDGQTHNIYTKGEKSIELKECNDKDTCIYYSIHCDKFHYIQCRKQPNGVYIHMVKCKHPRSCDKRFGVNPRQCGGNCEKMWMLELDDDIIELVNDQVLNRDNPVYKNH